MEDDINIMSPSQPIQTEPVPIQPKPKTRLIVLLAILGVAIAGYFVSAKLLNFWPFSYSGWQVYSDEKYGFSFKYPKQLFLITNTDGSDRIYIQNMPAPNLDPYSDDLKNRGWFVIELSPFTFSDDFNFTEDVAYSRSCQIDKTEQINISGVESYSYVLKGEYEGEVIVTIPYDFKNSQGLNFDFHSSYNNNSAQQKNAILIFNKILAALKFTTVSSRKDLEQEQERLSSQVTWQKYSDAFIEFEYPSDFVIGTPPKVITEHKINLSGKDMYGFVGIILQHKIFSSHMIIGVTPKTLNYGGTSVEEQFKNYPKTFEAEIKEYPTDTLTKILVDNYETYLESRNTYDNFDYATCEGSGRIGTKSIYFLTKNNSYNIELVWTGKSNNDPDSAIQKEFQKLISTFHVLQP